MIAMKKARNRWKCEMKIGRHSIQKQKYYPFA